MNAEAIDHAVRTAVRECEAALTHLKLRRGAVARAILRCDAALAAPVSAVTRLERLQRERDALRRREVA